MFIEKSLYTDILRNMPIPTVDILFLNSQNQILLGKRNNEPLMGIYYIPGGRVNKGERSLDATKRKVFEELGINIDISRLQFVGVYDDIFENSAFDDITTHCIPVTYLYQLNSYEELELSLGDAQHSDLQFFSLDDPSLHEMVQMRVRYLRKLLKV
ncbi:NUDIX domain-containing protein [Candidatus Gracilibacteria bacterium]|nr:NUDIX domain-containing protein [Candidatus Gracilibacteria bacterium]